MSTDKTFHENPTNQKPLLRGCDSGVFICPYLKIHVRFAKFLVKSNLLRRFYYWHILRKAFVSGHVRWDSLKAIQETTGIHKRTLEKWLHILIEANWAVDHNDFVRIKGMQRLEAMYFRGYRGRSRFYQKIQFAGNYTDFVERLRLVVIKRNLLRQEKFQGMWYSSSKGGAKYLREKAETNDYNSQKHLTIGVNKLSEFLNISPSKASQVKKYLQRHNLLSVEKRSYALGKNPHKYIKGIDRPTYKDRHGNLIGCGYLFETWFGNWILILSDVLNLTPNSYSDIA